MIHHRFLGFSGGRRVGECVAVFWLAGIFALLDGSYACASEDWVSGPALQRQLDSPVDILWSGTPLRHAVGNLSREYRVAVLIDRRVDPEQKVEMQFSAAPLRTVFNDLARRRGLGVSVLGDVVYLGPAAVDTRLRTLSALREEELRRLPAAPPESSAAPSRSAGTISPNRGPY